MNNKERSFVKKIIVDPENSERLLMLVQIVHEYDEEAFARNLKLMKEAVILHKDNPKQLKIDEDEINARETALDRYKKKTLKKYPIELAKRWDKETDKELSDAEMKKFQDRIAKQLKDR